MSRTPISILFVAAMTAGVLAKPFVYTPEDKSFQADFPSEVFPQKLAHKLAVLTLPDPNGSTCVVIRAEPIEATPVATPADAKAIEKSLIMEGDHITTRRTTIRGFPAVVVDMVNKKDGNYWHMWILRTPKYGYRVVVTQPARLGPISDSHPFFKSFKFLEKPKQRSRP